MNDATLAVIGTGSVGSMALWAASRAGIPALAFEAQSPGHSRSAVGGDTRLFRMTYRDPHPYYPVLVEARKRWRELEADSAQSILHQCGGLSIGSPDGPYIPALLDSIEQTDAPVELLDHDEMATRYPQHALEPGECAIFDRKAGSLRTDVAVTSAVEVAKSRGAEVVSHAAVDRLEEVSDGAIVHAGDRSWKVDRVIVAAGAGSGTLLPDWLKEHVEVRRLYLTWFAAGDITAFQPEAFPVFIRISGERSMCGAPTVDGATVKATLDGRSGPLPESGTLLRDLTAQETAETEETVTRFFPGLRPSIVRSDAYPDLNTNDQAGLLGFLPGSRRIYCATGFSGSGFKLASAFGTIAARECATDHVHEGIEFLRPSRFTSVHGALQSAETA